MESMAPHSGDGPAKATVKDAPRDRRVPLTAVVFREPTAMPGSSFMFTNFETGMARSAAGVSYTCPQAYFDPDHRTVVIGEREYPMERVHYFIRAKMARKVTPAAPDPGITIGVGNGKPPTP